MYMMWMYIVCIQWTYSHLNVPYSASCVNRTCAYDTWVRDIPVEARDGGTVLGVFVVVEQGLHLHAIIIIFTCADNVIITAIML